MKSHQSSFPLQKASGAWFKNPVQWKSLGNTHLSPIKTIFIKLVSYYHCESISDVRIEIAYCLLLYKARWKTRTAHWVATGLKKETHWGVVGWISDRTSWILLGLRQWQWKVGIISHEAKANQRTEERKLSGGAGGECRVIGMILPHVDSSVTKVDI